MYLAMSMYILYICIWQVESFTVEYKQNVPNMLSSRFELFEQHIRVEKPSSSSIQWVLIIIIQIWPWLLVITGYSYGIIHSINGGFLVLITGKGPQLYRNINDTSISGWYIFPKIPQRNQQHIPSHSKLPDSSEYPASFALN